MTSLSTRALGAALGARHSLVVRDRRAGAEAPPVEPAAVEVVAPWRFPLVMAGINVVLVVLCLVLGAAVSAVVCASCAGYLAAVWRDARPERSNRGGGDLR